MTLYIGLMSGTSMDGIDAALVDITTNTLIYGITKKYSIEVKKRIENLLCGIDLSLAAICQLNTLIGREFADAVNELLEEARVSSQDIQAIGSHGQTVCHNTHEKIPYTLQIGCAHTISSLTKITVVADFRTRDLVNGGQGAPFAPLYHHELFAQKNESIAVVNIGGISNITLIQVDKPVRGWDLGPGNCLMDAWIMKHHGVAYDANGAWASQGALIKPLLESFLADPFVSQSAPKSIGKEYFSLTWLLSHLKNDYKSQDVQKTLLAYTARIITDEILNNEHDITKLYVCGGGAHNVVLMQMLSQLLPKIMVNSVDDVGVSADYLEAMMFAWLASQTINHIPIDLRSITGSKIPAILGAIYPAIK